MLFTGAAFAAPYTPKDDSEIVERLPLSATDPSVRRVDSLRKQIAARPGDNALRVELAQRYFDLSMAQGDPRYVGYASAAIAPLASAKGEQAAAYWLVHGMLLQYSHDFDNALAALNRATQVEPTLAPAMAWRAAIYMVQARYPQVLAECANMRPLVAPLVDTGCVSYVRATTGELAAAHDALAQAVAATPNAPSELLVWDLTRLADMAARLGRNEQAAQYYARAFKLGVTDQYLLGAYSDWLLDQKRPAEVMKLLADWERSDVLLLRLALAGKAAKDERAAGWAAQLRDRFKDAALRGDRLHEQEAARFQLDVEGQPRKALELAARNYTVQKEPRDAEILMRTALAAGDAAAAQPAVAWMRESRHEDPAMQRMAAQLGGAPAPSASAASGVAK